MKQNITIGKDLKIHPEDGFEDFIQHSVGTKYIVAKLDGWALAEGECLFIAFEKNEDGGNKINPMIMNRTLDGKSYYAIIPEEVMHDDGEWDMCVCIKYGWDEESGTAKYCITGAKHGFNVISSILDESGKIITQYDLANMAQFQRDLENGLYATRGIYPWNSEFVYGAEELVFYPNFGEYGALVKSLKAENTDEPFVDGVPNAENWLLISDFNILTELYALENDVRHSADAAATSEQNAAASAAEAEDYFETIKSWMQHWADCGIQINTDYESYGDLPTPGDSHYIYFILNGSTDENSYDEYIWVEGKNAYEKVGSTQIDLTAYATKTMVDEKLSKSGDIMTGALRTPKICVDKIARNNEDSILIEPAVKFNSTATFDKTLQAKTVWTETLSGNSINVTTSLNFGKEIKNDNGEIIGYSYGTSDLNYVDNVKCKKVHADNAAYFNKIYFNSDSPSEYGRYDPYIFHDEGVNGLDLFIRSGKKLNGEYGAVKCYGSLCENDQRVYSPNNKPKMHLVTVYKSSARTDNGGNVQLVFGATEEIVKNKLKDMGFILGALYFAQKTGISQPTFETGRVELQNNYDEEGNYDGFNGIIAGLVHNWYYDIYEVQIVID